MRDIFKDIASISSDDVVFRIGHGDDGGNGIRESRICCVLERTQSKRIWLKQKMKWKSSIEGVMCLFMAVDDESDGQRHTWFDSP